MPDFTVIFVIASLCLVVLIIYGTIAKNRWGLAFGAPNCPRCGAGTSFIRVPKSLSQAIWGGYTCSKCGCVMDKFGREVSK